MRPSEAVVCTRPRQSLGSISGHLNWNDAVGVGVGAGSCRRIENVGPQLAPGDLSPALLIQTPSERAIKASALAQCLSQVTNRRPSVRGENRLLVWCQSAEVGAKCVHGR